MYVRLTALVSLGKCGIPRDIIEIIVRKLTRGDGKSDEDNGQECTDHVSGTKCMEADFSIVVLGSKDNGIHLLLQSGQLALLNEIQGTLSRLLT